MIRMIALAAAAAATPVTGAMAQEAPLSPTRPIMGTRLDVVATGEVRRVPDVAQISTGVVTQAPTATAAIADNARQMERVRAALKRAGVADRDIQTSAISLSPDYRYIDNQPPQLTGYRAGNQVTVRFRDIANTGKILDALVGNGANQINGPAWTIENQDAAMDEARADALAKARARAGLYAQALGKRVGRILSVSETGAMRMPGPMPYAMEARGADAASTPIDPGEQAIEATLSVSFELE
ncbi:SIMPL domain-containing protein [Allosphingosinicella flava]|nr:SIMPL domain-containing protein [Sphingosinicella flava]